MTKIDIDKGYQCDEHPASFNARWQQIKVVDGVSVRSSLTESERATTADCKTAEDAFRVLYPGYKSLDDYRQEQLAKLAEEKAKAVSAEVVEGSGL